MTLLVAIKSKADKKNRESNRRGSSVDKNFKVMAASGAKSRSDKEHRKLNYLA